MLILDLEMSKLQTPQFIEVYGEAVPGSFSLTPQFIEVYGEAVPGSFSLTPQFIEVYGEAVPGSFSLTPQFIEVYGLQFRSRNCFNSFHTWVEEATRVNSFLLSVLAPPDLGDAE